MTKLGLIIGGLLLTLSACNYTPSDSPYHSRESCMADRKCSEQFTDYLNCKAQYETGC